MTYQEHINRLVKQAHEDFGAAEALAKSGYSAHALFWLHLVLEKFCKAVWMKKKEKTDYPYIHNLVKLLKDADVSLNDEQIIFYTDMNQFQTKGRYEDELEAMEKTVTDEVCEIYFQKTKIEIQWLKNLLQ